MALRKKEIPLNGKLVTAKDGMTIGNNFKTLTNMRYTDSHPESIGGMTKINTTALATYPKIRSGFHFKKDLPVESHVLVQSYNNDLSASQVLQNTTSIPNQGDFSTTTLHTDASGADTGRFADTLNGGVVYCNNKETMFWGGDEYPSGSVINYDPDGNFSYDYTEQARNTLTDAANIATLHLSAGGIDSNTMLMLHFDNNVTDSSPTTAHTVTNTNVTFDSTNKVFGTHAALFNGTSAYLTIPDNADFDFSGGVWTIDCRARITSLSANNILFYQKTDIESVAFTSGSEEPSVGDQLDGAISTQTAIVDYVELISGTWGSGDAAGTLYVHTKSGAWVAENLDINGGTANVMTIAGDTSDAGDNYIKIYIDTNGADKIEVYEAYGAGGVVAGIATANSAITTNAFYHIEAVENGDSWYIFVNGLLEGADTDTSRAKNYISTVYIGHDNTSYYDGQIDEYRVSNTAKHTVAFETPAAAYTTGTNRANIYIGTIMPAKGFKIIVQNANTSSSSMGMDYWNGTAWIGVSGLIDNTSSGGVSLAQTGIVTFTSTADAAKTKIINYNLLYWYRLSVSGADSGVTLSQITADIPFQGLKEIWDGTFAGCLSCQVYDDSTYNDNTTNVYRDDYSSANTASFADLSSLAAGTDYLVLGFWDRTRGVHCSVVSGSANTTAGTMLSVSYWNGTSWVDVGAVSDGTSEGAISFAKSGVISWNNPGASNEFKHEIAKSLPLYYYKLTWNKALSSDVKVDYIGGIASPKVVNGYKFPVRAFDRVWLCSENSEKKNKVICSSQYTDNVFNGTDSYTFSFGGDSALTAAIPLYAQFGASLYELLIFCKEHETWFLLHSGAVWEVFNASRTKGCVAPQTMRTAHIGYDVSPGMNRQIAIWQGSDGIYLFDGRMVHSIHEDIKNYFDKRNTGSINPSKKADSIGFIDQQNQEYHWCFASGTSTTLDKELVYDITKQKWYEVDRGTGNNLQCGIEVTDTNGNTYNYATLDTGYMERLENGNDFDGTAIVSTMELADIPLIDYGTRSTLRQILLYMVGKNTTSNSVTGTHCADTSTAGTSFTMAPSTSNKRVAQKTDDEGLNGVLHSLKFQMTTDNETKGFEPLLLVLFYEDKGLIK